ncbi:MAG: GNAT family N-acetyltransferase [Candidatus Bipolaricaulota bacterium]|nr:GNAT family N-acetyltransferase [Candidatus Bipolaricaulota bacterium]MDW8030712.1 GNAT family protein [Candidatus Bipolaricaulota bacterium]
MIDHVALHNHSLAYGLYAAEAIVLFLNFAFGELNLHRIEAETLAFNYKVLRAIEKFGFRREGVKRECVYRTGQYVDLYCYGLLESEFYQSPHARWVLSRLGLLQKDETNRLKGESHVPAEIR